MDAYTNLLPRYREEAHTGCEDQFERVIHVSALLHSVNAENLTNLPCLTDCARLHGRTSQMEASKSSNLPGSGAQRPPR